MCFFFDEYLPTALASGLCPPPTYAHTDTGKHAYRWAHNLPCNMRIMGMCALVCPCVIHWHSRRLHCNWHVDGFGVEDVWCLWFGCALAGGRGGAESDKQKRKLLRSLHLWPCYALVMLVSQDRSSKGSGKAAGKKQESNVPWTAHWWRDRHGDLAIRVTQCGPP